MSESRGEVTRLVGLWARGDNAARDQLFPVVYDELRGLARGYLRREGPGHTLQPTALVHEAFLRFSAQGAVPVECRGQFMALIAQAMRRVLVDHARGRNAGKRGGGATRLELDEVIDGVAGRQAEILELDDLLNRLSSFDIRQAEIVVARVFGGFDVVDIAQMLGISPATVKREWAIAKAWLHRELIRGHA